MRITFEFAEHDESPWGGRQPTFERLACDGPDRYFLVYPDASGEQVRVQLAPARYHAEPLG